MIMLIIPSLNAAGLIRLEKGFYRTFKTHKTPRKTPKPKGSEKRGYINSI
jgi:hypothetical protein